MIIVKNRELLIPRNEQLIGTDLDASSEMRFFRVDRMLQGSIDIANYTFVCDVKYSNGTTDVISLSKDIDEEHVTLGITFTSAIMNAHEGNLWVQLRATSTGGNSWSTAAANMYIVNRVLNPGTVTASTTLSELEQLEVNVETNEGLRQTAETGRVSAETARVNEENARASAETGRVNAEALRVAAENYRSQHYLDNTREAEGWAKGTQGGVPVQSGSPYYENNAKYYSEQASLGLGKMFIAEKSTTTLQEIMDAVNAGKTVCLVENLSGSELGDYEYYYLTQHTYVIVEGQIASGFYYFYKTTGGGYKCRAEGGTASSVPTYTSVNSNIAKTQLSSNVRSSLEKADSAYQKPNGGIPKTDLVSAVQTSLGKADTALQSVKTINGQTMVGTGNITVAEAPLSGTENPTSSVVASYVGQHYINTTTKIEWVSVSINPTVWEIVNKSLVTNRNLLDNPWFTVNQREATEASNNGYGVDRWMGSYTVLSNGITVGSSYGALQKMESSVLSQLYGKTITGSFIDGSGNVHSGTIVAENSSNWQAMASDGNVMMYFYNSGVYLWGSGNVKAVKLELGSISTLANDVAPDYAEELMKCQRYFIKYDQITTPNYFSYMDGGQCKGYVYFNYNCNMRAIPSVQFGAGTTLVTDMGSTSFTIYELTPTQVSKNTCLFFFRTSLSSVNSLRGTLKNVTLSADL